MKIAIEAQRLFRNKKHGMEIVALELIRQLQKIDHSNEYIIFTRKDKDNRCLEQTENFKIVEIPGYSYADWEQYSLPRALRREKPDILHCTANTSPLLLNIPLVLTLHDIIYLESFDFSGSIYQNFGNLYRRFIVPKTARNCEIITVSEYERDKIAGALRIRKEQIHVIYNAFNPQFKVIRESAELEAVRLQYNLPTSFILFFGNTAPKKNTKGVLESYAYYCGHCIEVPLPLVITDCTEEYIHGILRMIGAVQVEKYIQVKDYISFDDLPQIYNLATLFLYPSLRESFGMPIIEAMACGTPVITSDSSAMPEVAGGAAWLADPLQPERIGEGIIALLEDRKCQEELIGKGLQNVKRFSWEITAEKVLNVYKSLEK